MAKVEALVMWSIEIPEDVKNEEAVIEYLKQASKSSMEFRLLNLEDDYGKSPFSTVDLEMIKLDKDFRGYVENQLLQSVSITGVKDLEISDKISQNSLIIAEKINDKLPAGLNPIDVVKKFILKFITKD